MSRSIDEKVVELRFDNKQFESGVKQSLGTLNNLKSAINKSASGKALDDLTKTANKLDLSNISNGISMLQDRFSTLGIVGMRVIQNITDGLMNGLSKGIKTATDAIISGGVKRAMNIENAHFQLQGLIDDETEVQAIMQDAMDSVDGTAYAYDEAAKAASMFAASGLKSGEQMQRSLKAIAGTAATTNAEYERVADIFTKIAGKGRIQADELNQFASMGMNAAAALTKYINEVNDGTLDVSDHVKEMVRNVSAGLHISEEDVRNWVSKGKISFELFSEAMATTFGDHAKDANQTFTGSMANIRAALARTGALFVSPLIKQNGPFVQFFNAIRVKVNEFNKALGATNGLADRFTKWVNNLITKLTSVVEGFQVANTYVQKFGDGTTKVFETADKSIQKWGDGTEKVVNKKIYTPFHALSDTVDIVINSVKILGQILDPIGKAFKETFVFDSSGLYKGLESIKELTASFKLSDGAAKNLHDGFKGLFDVSKLLFNTIKDLGWSLAKKLFPSLKEASGSFLDMFGNMGRALSEFSEFAKENNLVDEAIKKIGETIDSVKNKITGFIGAFKNTFKIDIFSSIREEISKIEFSLDTIKNVMKSVKDTIMSLLEPILTKIGIINYSAESLMGHIMPIVEKLADALAEMIKNIDPIKAFFTFLNGGLLAAATIGINKLLKTIKSFKAAKFAAQLKQGFTSGTLLQSVKNVFNSLSASINNLSKVAQQSIKELTKGLTESLNALTNNVKVDTLKKIAEALLILSVALTILGSLNYEELAKGITAVTIMIGELVGSMILLDKFMSSSKTLKGGFAGILDAARINELAGSLIKIAAAVLILSFAVRNLASLDLAGLAKGLIGVTILLVSMIGALAIINTLNVENIKSIGFGMIEIALAVSILSKAVMKLSTLKIDELVKGLLGVVTVLLAMGAFVKLAGGGEKMISIGLGLILVSVAISKLSKVIKDLSGLSIEGIARGLVGLAGSLMSLAIFVMLLDGSKMSLKNILGLAVIMKVLNDDIVPVMQNLARFSWNQLGISLAGLAGVLTLLIGSIFIMGKIKSTSMKSIVIFILLAKGLIEVMKPVAELAKFSWEQIGKSLSGLAGVLAILIGTIFLLDKVSGLKSVVGVLAIALLVKTIQPIVPMITSLAKMGWENIGQSLSALGGALLILIGSMYLAGLDALKTIPGALAVALLVNTIQPIVPIITALSKLGWEDIGQSLAALGGVLLILVGAMYLAGINALMSIPGALAIALLVNTIQPIVPMLTSLSKLGWESIGQSLAALGGALLILVGAMYLAGINALMSIPGALAIALLVNTIQPIVPILQGLAALDWEGLKVSLIALGGALAILIGAMYAVGLGAPVALAGAAIIIGAIGGLALAVAGMAAAINVAVNVMTNAAMAVQNLANMNFSNAKENAIELAKTLAILIISVMLLGNISTMAMPGATSLSLFSDLLVKALNNLSQGISGLVDGVNSLKDLDPDTLKNSCEQIAYAMKVFGQSIKSFGLLSNIGASAFLKISNAIGVLAPALVMLKDADPEQLGKVMTKLGESLSSFGESLKSFGLISSLIGPNALLTMAEAISKMAPALFLLSRVPADKLTTIMGTLSYSFKAFAEALDATPFWGSTMRANGIGALIDNIGKLASALPPFIAIPANDAKIAMKTLGDGFKAFGEALTATPFWDSSGRGNGIANLIDVIPTLTNVLPAFIDLLTNNADGVDTAFATLGQGFKLFGEAIEAAPLFNSGERAEGIVALVDSISTLRSGIESFIGVDAGSFAMALEQIATAFSAFGTSISYAPLFNSDERAEGIATLVDSISTLATGITDFVAIEADADTLSSVLDSIGTAFKAFGDAISNAPLFNADERSTALVTIVDSISTLADGVKILAELEPQGDSVTSILDSIGSAMVNFGDAIKKTPFWGTSGRSEALISVINSLDSLKETVVSLSTLDSGVLDSILGSLSTGLTNLGESLKSFDDNANTNTGIIQNLITVVKDVTNIDSNNLMQIARNLLALLNVMKNADSGALTSFGQGLEEAAKVGLTQFIAAFQNTEEAVAAITEFMRLITEAIKTSTLFKDAGSESVVNYRKGIEAKYSEAATAGRNLATRVINALKAMVAQFHSVGTTSAQGYAAGILAGGATAAANAKTIATTAANNMDPKDDSGVSVFYKQGMNAGQGYAQGIASQLKAVQEAAAKLAKAAEAALAKAQEAQSPAKKFIRQGEYAGEGYVIGITSWMQDAYNAGKGLANAVDNSLEDAGSLTPVITPIVDLTNVMDAAGTINSLFSSAMMSTGTRTNSVAGSFATATNNSSTEFQNEAVGSNGNTYNFIQNNNSPKSLSRVEIYRDSKNLFKQYREAVEGV